jgi:hypothetical protein
MFCILLGVDMSEEHVIRTDEEGEEVVEEWFEVDGKRLTDEEWEAHCIEQSEKSLEVAKKVFEEDNFRPIGPKHVHTCEDGHEWTTQRMHADTGKEGGFGFVQYTEGCFFKCPECEKRPIKEVLVYPDGKTETFEDD